MNWIKSEIVKAIARHALNAVGAWLVTKGFLASDQPDKVYGALCVLAAVGHSLWDKRQLIAAELKLLVSEAADAGKTPLLLALLIPALALTGCHTTQVIDNTSGTGLNVDASVPIPMSGGATLLGLKVTAGMWKNSAVVQPVSTNKLTVPAVAINQFTRGSVTTAANAGGTASTNGAVNVGGASLDINGLTTGDASLASTNATLESH